MRIVHVVVTDAYAGVEAHVARLARAQSSSGHSVVIVGGDQGAIARVAGHGVSVMPGASLHDARRSLRDLPERPDVVHAHMTSAEFACLLYSPVLFGSRPMVCTRHFPLVRGRSAQGRVASALIRRRVAAQISVSRYVANGIDGSSQVVYPGVEVRPDAIPAEQQRTVVLLAQRLEPEKRSDLAIDVFLKSGLAGLGWRMEIAGQGSQRASLEKMVADADIADSVKFLGRRSDIAALMANSAILLAPCPVEGLGLSVLEAMSAGLPVVASAAGGHLEILECLDQRALFDPKDPGEGGRRLAELASDVTGRTDFGSAAQARQRRCFTMEAQVAGTDAVYRSVL